MRMILFLYLFLLKTKVMRDKVAQKILFFRTIHKLKRLARQKCDVDFLDHFHAMKHFA